MDFFTPFTNRVWQYLTLAIIINALINWVVDPPYETRTFQSVTGLLYLSLGSFTDCETMSPKKKELYILNLGFSLLLYIIGASYTASLASFLISQTVPVHVILSIDDANSRNMRVCVLQGTAQATIISLYYPNIKLVVLKLDMYSLYHN